MGSALVEDDTLLGAGCRRHRGFRRKLYRDVVGAATQVVDERIAGYGIYPLPEGVLRGVIFKVDIDLQEGILQQVVGLGAAPRALLEESIYRLTVAREEVEDAQVKVDLEKEEFIRAQQNKLQKKTRTRAPRKTTQA